MNVMMIKLTTGEELVSDVQNDYKKHTTLELSNPFLVALIPTNDPKQPIATRFLPWAEFVEAPIKIDSFSVIYALPAKQNMVEFYTQQIEKMNQGEAA